MSRLFRRHDIHARGQRRLIGDIGLQVADHDRLLRNDVSGCIAPPKRPGRGGTMKVPVAERGDEHPLIIRLVEAFRHDRTTCKKAAYRCFFYFQVLRLDHQSRIDSQKILPEGFDLGASHLIGKIELPIQIGRLDQIEINDPQPAKTRSHEQSRAIRPQTASAGNTDPTVWTAASPSEPDLRKR